MKNRTLQLTILAALLAAGRPAGAQETRSIIFGRILDPSDAPVAGATVTVTNADTNTTVTRKTNETGYYEANFLLPGTYSVTAGMEGFKKVVQRGIALPISTRQEITMRLEIGAVTESVSVTSEAPLLETNAVSSGMVIDSRSMAELPVLSNSPVLLAKYSAGMQSTGTNRYLSFNSQSGASSINTSGNVGGNEYTIDGALNASDGRQISYIPHTDALLEFKVETSGFDASVGATTGASVAMMTRAGTNDLHGSASWMHWQQRWTGTPFFTRQLWYRNIAAAESAGNQELAEKLRNTPKQPSGHSNNYSGSMGGPVFIPKVYDGRNKMFFFFSYNGFKDIKPAEGTPQATVPTMQQRTGDFSDLMRISLNPNRFQIYDPLSVKADGARPGHFVRTPFAGNIIPKSRIINPAYNTYAGFLPAPNSNPLDPTRDSPYNNYQAVAQPYNWDYNSISSRLDYSFSEKHRFFARGSWFDYKEDRNDWTYETARGLQSDGLHRTNPSGTVDYVWVPTSNTIWNFAGSLNHYYQTVLVKKPLEYKPSDVGLPKYMDDKAGALTILPQMNWDGYSGISQPRPYVNIVQTLSSKADVTHIRGNHTLRAGFDMRQYYRTGYENSNSSGLFSFDSTYTRQTEDNNVNPAGNLGHGWAAFLLGIPSGMRVDTVDSVAMNNPYYGWFAQDNWRVTPKLSLTLGLRFEREGGPTERYNRMIGWYDRSLGLPISALAEAAYAKTPVAQLPANQFKVAGGSVYPGAGGAQRSLWNAQQMLLPRVAAAYQLSSRTVIRAGYGLFYDTYNVIQRGYNYTGFSRSTSTVVTNDFGQTWNTGNPGAGISMLADPFPVRANGTRFDVPTRDALGAMQVVGRSFSYRDPEEMRRAQQYRIRVGVQHQLDAHTVIEAGYVTSRASNVYVSANMNPVPGQYWSSELKRNDVVASDLNSNVTNPFYLTNFSGLQATNPLVYQDMSTNGFYTSRTIRKNQMLKMYPQMTGLTYSDAPRGRVKTDALEVSLQRRFTQGFNLSLNYSAMRQRDQDFYANEFDADPSWRISNNSRPHRLAGTGIYELPFGKGRRYLRSGIANVVLGGWQIGATYEYQPGGLLGFNNLYFYGDPSTINTGEQTLDRWFNTTGVSCAQTPGSGSGFERCTTRGPAAYQTRVFPTRLDGLRQGDTNTWNANMIRDFKIGEKANFLLRLDVINVANRSEWSGPNTDPFSSNFGKVTSVTQAQKRFFQLQGKIRF